MHLRRIQQLMAEKSRWDEDAYPSLERVTASGDVHLFKLHHLLAHLMEGIGRLADALEKADHGHRAAADDKEAVCEIAANIVANALHYAGICGIDAAEIEALVLKESSLPKDALRCRSWSGACGGKVEFYVMAGGGISPMCAYHASVAEDVIRDGGVPMTLVHHDANFVDRTGSG